MSILQARGVDTCPRLVFHERTFCPRFEQTTRGTTHRENPCLDPHFGRRSGQSRLSTAYLMCPLRIRSNAPHSAFRPSSRASSGAWRPACRPEGDEERLSLFGGYRYAAFFIDEHSRFVMVEILKSKTEVIDPTKRAIAKFDALVGVPTGEDGKPLARPKVRRLHRDHEGQLESAIFEKFRAEASLHSTTSPSHDHNLNPIAESTIRTIDVLATTFARQAGAPPGFWPEAFRHAVDFHNVSSSTSVGSSTADANISPYQRFTLKQPKIMDLCTFGSCAVVLKSPQHIVKGSLSPRGWVGTFLGRCTDSPGCWEVWVPEISRKVCSSSVLVDEERFPWLGKDAYCPLSPPERQTASPQPSLGGTQPLEEIIDPSASGTTSINDILLSSVI